ncbi:hypothetical protein MYAM1_003375 [Malassezia yamatoensis]|uniref:WD40 repeat-like protein n=1 Tax=Malassezia yamatoensis TaxID=253288 RepID=A0AAJ5YTV8_9BASI|nr:hypothetical protein MYAM1_003375 [Malassezia yamatoensis]
MLSGHHDVLRAASVDRTWNRLASDPWLWKELFYRNPGWEIRWDMLPQVASTSSETSVLSARPSIHTHWKAFYRGRHALDRRWNAFRGSSHNHKTFAHFRPNVVRLRGHSDSVYCCSIDSGLGSGHVGYVLSGSRDKTVRVWDSATGECVSVLRGHEGSVVCMTSRNETLVTGSSDGTARIWVAIDRARSNYVIKNVLRGHRAGVLDVSMDDTYIITASRDKTLRVWRRSTAELVHVYTQHKAPVNACSLDAGVAVSGAGDGSLHVWLPDTGKLLQMIHEPRCGIATVLLRENILFAGSSDHFIRLWNRFTGECLAAFQAHTHLVRAIAYDAARHWLVSGGWDKKTRLWSMDPLSHPTPNPMPELALELGMHQARVFAVAIDTTRLISACEDSTLWITDFGKQGLPSHIYA